MIRFELANNSGRMDGIDDTLVDFAVWESRKGSIDATCMRSANIARI